jgi:hypothetical protein
MLQWQLKDDSGGGGDDDDDNRNNEGNNKSNTYSKNTLAEDISDGLVSLGYDVISIKQMTTTRRSPPEGTSNI